MNKIKFVELLQQQIQQGNLRSIQLNALPSTSLSKLDLGSISEILPNKGEDFINTILNTAKFEFDISITPVNIEEKDDLDEVELTKRKELKVKQNAVAKRLNSIFYEYVNEYQELGIKTFALGYPLVIKRSKLNPEKFIKAPLLIWYLDIQRDKRSANKWVISRDEESPIILNPLLSSFIEKDEFIKLKDIDKDLLEDNIIDINELNSLLINFYKQLKFSESINFNDLLKSKINTLGGKDSVELSCKNNGNLTIINNGVFGCYRGSKQSIIEDLKLLLENTEILDSEEADHETYQKISTASVETDPSQQDIIYSLNKDTRILIQGPPGTGKSQSLTAIITNAIANGSKCLVVCEKKTALDVLMANLNKLDIGDLAIVIDDVIRDRKKVVDSVRTRIDRPTYYSSFTNSEYQKLEEKHNELKVNLNQKHSKLAIRIHGENNWTSMVGRFLKSSTLSKNLLTSKEFKIDLELTYDEFAKVEDIINRSKFLIKEARDINSLKIINDNVIVDKKRLELREDIEKFIDTSIENINRNLEEIESIRNKYKDSIQSLFEDYYSYSLQELLELEKVIDYVQGTYGSNALSLSSYSKFKLGVLSPIITKYKNIKNLNKDILNKFGNLKLKYISNEYFSVNLKDIESLKSLESITEDIKELRSGLEKWKSTWEKTKIELLNEFSLVNVIKLVDLKPELEKIKISLDETNNYANSNNIFKEKIDLDLKGSFINLLGYLNNSKLFLSDVQGVMGQFLEYYEWRHYYLLLDEKYRIVMDKLIENVEIDNWGLEFESWFYNQILAKNHDEDLPKDEYTLYELKKLEPKLKELQLDYIKNRWKLIQSESVSNKRNIESLYNKKGGAGKRRNSLRNIITTDFDLFTNFFPVVMVNPIVSSSLFPLKPGLFDVVIFDEASQLRLADTYPSLLRGKYKIISGDLNQMPPSSYFATEINIDDDDEEEDDIDEDLETEEFTKLQNTLYEKDIAVSLASSDSLLEYADNKGYKKYYLDIHYRSKHPALINFSNAAFYGNRLLPVPEKTSYAPIRYYAVNGLYKDRTNEDEADKVVDILLNEIKLQEDGEYPSIGIATFNINQRNLINEKIYDIRSKESKESEKIAKLFDKGLFIKNLENIQGDEKDIIIISTTFGVNKDGKFRQNFGPISQEQGFKLLNVLVTRAKKDLYICTSVPESKISTFRDSINNLGNKGSGILYAYLAYAKAVSDNNQDGQTEILSLLKKKGNDQENYNTENLIGAESPFEEEVIEYLAKEVDPKRIILQHQVGGFRIDIAVRSLKNGDPVLALECDGAKYHDSEEAYLWDIFRQKILEEYGFTFYRIWSTNWWLNTKKEADKLINFIKEFDKKGS